VINGMVKELLRTSKANVKLDDNFKQELQDRIEKELNKS